MSEPHSPLSPEDLYTPQEYSVGQNSTSNFDNYLSQVDTHKDENQILGYFNDHDIFPNLDQIMQDVLEDRPDDPEKYILRKLRLWDARDSGNDEMARILVESPTTKIEKDVNSFFNPQLQRLEKEDQKHRQMQQLALEYEKRRALEHYATNIDESALERNIATEEASQLRKLLAQFHKTPESVTPGLLEKTVEFCGDTGEGMLSLRTLRFMLGLGLTHEERQLSKNALKFFRQHANNPHIIPLNHPLRLNYIGAIHNHEVHALHHRIAPLILPLQGPSICYQSVHKLFLEYALSQGKYMTRRGIRQLDSFMAAEMSADVGVKGLHTSYQFRILMRVCHTWLTAFTEPVKDWSRLIHLALYSFVGYEGLYLHSALIKDLGKMCEEVLLAELQNSVQKEKFILIPCQLCLQLCFRWLVRETAIVLDDMRVKDRSLFEEGRLERMTVTQFLKIVLNESTERPARLESTTLYQGKATKPIDTSVIPLNFNNVEDERLRGKLLTCRGCLAQLAESSELIEIYQKFGTHRMDEVADQLDILAFAERDDLAVLLSIGLRCIDDHSNPKRINHMTRVRYLDTDGVDNLFLRCRLIIAFVDAMLALQYRSTLRGLESGVIGRDFSAPSLAPILMKCMVPHPHRPTILEVLLKRYRFCTLESLTSFFGVINQVMMGQGGLQRSIFEASVVGIIFVNYLELLLIINRYLSELETTAVQLVYTRWNRLIRNAILSVTAYCIYSRIQSFSDSIQQATTVKTANSLAVHSAHPLSLPANHLEAPLILSSTSSVTVSEGLSVPTTPNHQQKQQERVQARLLSNALVERELFALLRRRVDDNCDTGIFMDSIQNPITRERLTGQETCFMVRHWDYVKLGAQFRNPLAWFNEFSSKVDIMVQHDISPDETVKMATVPLMYIKDIIQKLEEKKKQEALEKNTSHQAHRHNQNASTTVRQGSSTNAPSSAVEMSSSTTARRRPDGSYIDTPGVSESNLKAIKEAGSPNDEDLDTEQEVFDFVVCSHACFSHLLGAFLYEIHTSGISAFIFSETSRRWNSLSLEDRHLIIAHSLPRDINFSSNAHEQARKDIEPCLSKFFLGEISRRNLGTLVVVLFNCGVIPCRHFDFFSTLQKLVYRRLDTPHAAPYFTHLAHRLLKYPLFHVERRIDHFTNKADPMLEAWEEFLRDPSSVFEATRAILDLIPREIMLENDVAMLRDKLRVMPQKYIQIFSSRAKEKDIITIAIWFRLHTGIPRFFMEAIGVTLFDVFISGYDAPYTPNDATKLIQRIDRAYRIMLTSTQPKMEELERMLKIVSAAVAPKHVVAVTATGQVNRNIEGDENVKKDDSKRHRRTEERHAPTKHQDMKNDRGELSLSMQHSTYNDLSFTKFDNNEGERLINAASPDTQDNVSDVLSPTSSRHHSIHSRHSHRHSHHHHGHRHRGRQMMKLFDRLITNDVVLDINAWRCHALSVHLVYAITHGRSFADGFYAEATLKYLTDLCFLLRYVSVDSYLRYFSQFFVRLLVAGLTPKLVRDICDRFFETLHALNIPFDTRMPTVLSIVLSTHLERSHDEVEQSEFILEKVKIEKDAAAFHESCVSFMVFVPLTRLYVYRTMYMGLEPGGSAMAEVQQSATRNSNKSPGLNDKNSESEPVKARTPTARLEDSEVVEQVQSMIKVVVEEIFLFLRHLAIIILERCDNAKTIQPALVEAFQEKRFCNAVQMIVLLSAGSSKVGLDFIAAYGEFIQQKHLPQQAVGPGPVLVWSRVVGTLTQFISTQLDELFTFSDRYNDIFRTFPKEIAGLNMEEVLAALKKLGVSLNVSGTTSGMYHCGSIKRYYAELATVVYSAILDSKSDRSHNSQICRRLTAKIEGTTDDIVVAMCCLLPGLSRTMKDQDDLQHITGTPIKRAIKTGEVEFPLLLRAMFSAVQRLIVSFEKYTRTNFELYLEDRAGVCKTLTRALTAQQPPIAYQDGVPISMSSLMPAQVLRAKQGLLNTMLNCVRTIYVMDAKATAQIEQRHVSSMEALEFENKGIVHNISEEEKFMHAFNDHNARRGSRFEGQRSSSAGVETETAHNLRVLSFSLYNDMLITDTLMDTLFTSGLMTADVMRFVHIFDDYGNPDWSMSVSNTQNINRAQMMAEQERLRQIWRSLLCLVSQNFRRTITHSKIIISKELGAKTVKSYMRLQPLIYIDLLRQIENEREFVEWMGAEMPCYPYLEEWLLPALLRCACLVEDKMVVNATKKMRNDTREIQRQQQEQRAQREKEAQLARAAEALKAANEGQAIQTPTNRSDNNSDYVSPLMNHSDTNEKKKKTESVASSQQNAQRAVITHRLPLRILQNILLDIFHSKCQYAVISVVNTISKNSESGMDMKRQLSRAFFHQFGRQRLIHLTRRWCMPEEECNDLSDLWKRFRAQDRAPVDPTFPQPSPNNAPPSQLARELSNLMGEPLEQMESLVLTLDHLLITHLKSIFRWNTPAASLLAMFIYTDSVEFHRTIYYLHSRWCVVAITICNCLQAMGGVSEKQFISMVRVLRSIRVMQSVVQCMRDPKEVMAFLQTLPYNILINLMDTNDIQQRAITAAPATVNMTVVENSLQSLVEHTRELLVSLRAICERLQAGGRNAVLAISPAALLKLFTDWANIHSSQGKDATRASFRGLALLISTSVNDLSAEEARAIFDNLDRRPQKEECAFTECGGLGNSIAVEQLRMLYTLSMVCCNGLRDLVKDEKLISTTFLPGYVMKEIKVSLPDIDDLNAQRSGSVSVAVGASHSNINMGGGGGLGNHTHLSRPLVDTSIVAAIGRIVESGPITFPGGRKSNLAETDLRDGLLKLYEVLMDFVVFGLKRENDSLNDLFKEYTDRIKVCLAPGDFNYADVCVSSFYLLQEFRDRARLQLNPLVIKCTDYLITCFCRSVYHLFYNNCGEVHVHLRPTKAPVEPVSGSGVSRQTLMFLQEVSSSHFGADTSAEGSTSSFNLISQIPPQGLFLRVQYKISTGLEYAELEKTLATWEGITRRQHVFQFPYAEIKIFAYMWVTTLGDLLPLFLETIPLYLKYYTSLTKRRSTPDEFRTFFTFVHRLSFLAVSELWLTEHWVDLRIREWFSSVDELLRATGTDVSISQKLQEIASCGVHAISMSMANRVIRKDRASAVHVGKAKANGGNVASLEEDEAEFQFNAKEGEEEAAAIAAHFASFFNNSIRPAWAISMTYLLRRISELRKEGEQQTGQHLAMMLNNPMLIGISQAEQEVINEATPAESSLLKPYIDAQEAEEESSAEEAEVTASFADLLASTTLDTPKRHSPLNSSRAEKEKSRGKELSESKKPLSTAKSDKSDKKDKKKKNSDGKADSIKDSMEKSKDRLLGNSAPRLTDGFIDKKELAAAHTPECTWTVINGVVYDITRFVMMHPGGSDMMIQYCAGQDCTERFVQTHLGNERVVKQLEDMRIGVMKD